MKTVEQNIKDGMLPSFEFLNEADYETVFNQVGIPYDKSQGEIKDQKLSAEALERLKFNAKVNKALMVQKAQRANKTLLASYDNLIDEETATIENAKGKYDSEIPDMNAVVNALKSEKSIHENTVNNFTFSNVNGMLNGVQQLMVDSINTKMEKIDDKLEGKYNKLNEYNKTMQSARTNFKKQRTARRIMRVANRIKKLQEKQGRLIGQQKQIINKALAKYVEIKKKQMKEYGKTISNDRKYVNKMDDLNSRLQAAENDKRITVDEINSLDSSVKGKFNKIAFQMDKKRLESEIESLKRQMKMAEQVRQFHQRMKSLRGKNGLLNGYSILGIPLEEQQTEQVSLGM